MFSDPPHCTRPDCRQGRAPCRCATGRVPVEPIPAVEQEHPWLWLVYVAGAVLSLAFSYLQPGHWFA